MHLTYIKWLDDGQPKIFCECKCGGEIIIKPRHKYRGIPKYIINHYYKDKKYNISNSYQKWLDNGCLKIYCGCDCGEEIIIKSHHKCRGIPKYVTGHHRKIYSISQSYQKWLNNGCPKIYCKCPCGGEIIIINQHKYKGIPKYIKGHSNYIPEIIEKNRLLHSDKNNGMFGKQHTEESKQKNREHQPDFCGKNNPNWKGGFSFDPYCEKFNKRKKEEVREQYGRKCIICDKHEKDNITKTGKIRRLSVHHIDEDKEQGCNGKSWKLAPLCMHCHNSKKMEILNDKK